MNLADYKGRVDKCDRCTNSNPETPMDCRKCFSRGYVAECLKCMGKKQIQEGVAGTNNGTMWVTCPLCGGSGCFAVNKPADWDILHPEPVVEAKTPEEIALDTPPPAGDVTPLPRPAHIHNSPVGDSVSSVLA